MVERSQRRDEGWTLCLRPEAVKGHRCFGSQQRYGWPRGEGEEGPGEAETVTVGHFDLKRLAICLVSPTISNFLFHFQVRNGSSYRRAMKEISVWGVGETLTPAGAECWAPGDRSLSCTWSWSLWDGTAVEGRAGAVEPAPTEMAWPWLCKGMKERTNGPAGQKPPEASEESQNLKVCTRGRSRGRMPGSPF